jgi:hypothetical protein
MGGSASYSGSHIKGSCKSVVLNRIISIYLIVKAMEGRMSGDWNICGEKIISIQRTVSFDRKLAMLRRKRGAGSLAAEKAEEIMRSISFGKENDSRERFRLTRNGEYRIKSCIKYDLRFGYRLVCLRRDSHIVFLYIGSHDDCCRWMDRNRGNFGEEVNATTTTAPVICDASTDDFAEAPEEDEYEANLMSRIDDKILRRIFSGCFGG